MSKVLFVSTIPPVPVDSGKKVVINGFYKYFTERVGEGNVDFIVTSHLHPDDISGLKIRQLKQPSFIEKALNVLFYTLILKKKSLQESVIFSRKSQKYIKSIINDNNYDKIIFDTIRTGQYVENEKLVKGKHFIYLDDLFSVRYRKMIETYEKFPNIFLNALGNFEKYIPQPLKKIMNSKIERKLLKFEKEIVRKREYKIAKSFPQNFLINFNEANSLDSMLKNSNSESLEIKPFLDISQPYHRSNFGEPTFIFLGALNVPHNDYSITTFLRNNMDNLIDKVPNVKLLIIGKKPSNKLKDLVSKYKENVELKGYIEDIDKVFSNACAMIVPLLFGTGVKLKTLEAFSRGLPVLGTNYAFEGINVKANKHCIIEDEITKYPSIMEELIDTSYNNTLSKECYNLFVETYSKESIFNHYDDLFKLRVSREKTFEVKNNT